jgi:hypothetical protein
MDVLPKLHHPATLGQAYYLHRCYSSYLFDHNMEQAYKECVLFFLPDPEPVALLGRLRQTYPDTEYKYHRVPKIPTGTFEVEKDTFKGTRLNLP